MSKNYLWAMVLLAGLCGGCAERQTITRLVYQDPNVSLYEFTQFVGPFGLPVFPVRHTVLYKRSNDTVNAHVDITDIHQQQPPQ